MVGSHQVKFGEDGGSMENGGEILNMRDRVAIRDSYAVEGAVVTSMVSNLRGSSLEPCGGAMTTGYRMAV